MRTAGEVAKTALTSSGATRPPRSERDSDRLSQQAIDRLFMRMQSIYRQKWSSQFTASAGKAAKGGDAAYQVISAEWAKTLGDLDLEQIGHGIQRMKDSPRFDEWPPSPVQFRRLCKPRRETYERPEFQKPALPLAPTADKASALKHIAAIRAGLGQSGTHANNGKG